MSYCAPVVRTSQAGKQVAAAGHARMSEDDLTAGAEKWSVTDIPSGCCSPPPVIANGYIYFASLDDGMITVLKAGTNKPEVVA